MTSVDQATLADALEETLAYSRERDYVGWDKHDGMSSRVRKALPFETKWTNLTFQETIKRAPINVRRPFLVEQRPSPKGLCLFTMATLNAADITGKEQYRDEARKLVDRVVSHSLEDYDGFCLYHNHELQGLSSKTPIGTPGVVGTSFGVKALLQAEQLDETYLEVAQSAVDYIDSELHPHWDGDQARVSYKPTEETNTYTLNANALAARLYVDLYDQFGDEEFQEMARGILNYVASKQERIGGWEYMDPPSASHLGMDNYHNGFIIESFLRYQEVIDSDAFAETVDDALDFYRTVLYDNNGAPCWDEESTYPRDVHAAAQGIVTFTYAGNLEFARKIVDWTLENLYAGDGQFYYQQRKYYTKRFTLMRWCQAWMAYALSEFLHRN
ncbi:antibiotic ABC transporter permease [Natrialbaceae archaeon A-CW2]